MVMSLSSHLYGQLGTPLAAKKYDFKTSKWKGGILGHFPKILFFGGQRLAHGRLLLCMPIKEVCTSQENFCLYNGFILWRYLILELWPSPFADEFRKKNFLIPLLKPT